MSEQFDESMERPADTIQFGSVVVIQPKGEEPFRAVVLRPPNHEGLFSALALDSESNPIGQTGTEHVSTVTKVEQTLPYEATINLAAQSSFRTTQPSDDQLDETRTWFPQA